MGWKSSSRNQRSSSWNQQSKGKSKGTSKGKAKGKSKAKGKGKGTAEVTAEQEAEFKADQEEKKTAYTEETNRVMTHVETTGVFKRRIGPRGWIILDWLEDLAGNEELHTKLYEMCKSYRVKIRAKGGKDRLFSSHVVFMHDREMQKDHELPDEGDELKFKLYMDNHGVGATDIEIKKKGQRRRCSRSFARKNCVMWC